MIPTFATDDIVLVSELSRIGADDRAYRAAHQRGRLVRVHPGAYVDAAKWNSLGATEHYRRRVLAATLSSRTHPTLSHESAAVLWNVPLVGSTPKFVHVLATRAAGSRTEGAFRRHATAFGAIDVEEYNGVRLTGFVRTLVDFVISAPFLSAVVALDWALAPSTAARPKPVTTIDEILACADRLQIGPGRSKLMRALEFATPLSGSVGESVSRVRFFELGFPEPALQKEFRDSRGRIGWVDFWWPDLNLMGEFDGKAKYIREEFTKGLSAADVVIAEKDRENRLRATGRGMTRWDWEVAWDPAKLFEHLTAAGLPSTRRGGGSLRLR